MGSSNLPLILFYSFFGGIGWLMWKKNRVIGAIGGLVIGVIVMTLFALSLGG